MLNDVIAVVSEISTVSECSEECISYDDCLSFDYSVAQQRCILHSNIEGPPDDGDYINVFSTVPLQQSVDYDHYERLGVGNSTVYTFTGLSLEHRRTFYITLRLTNRLGHTNTVSSAPVLVDLTPPLPGRVLNAAEDRLENVGCGYNPEMVCVDDVVTSHSNHRSVGIYLIH